MNPSFVLFEAIESMPVFNDAEVPVLDSDPDNKYRKISSS